MRILLLAATPPEVLPTVQWLRQRSTGSRENVLSFPRCEVAVAFGGIGSMTTAFTLGQIFRPDAPVNLAIQAGVGGALDRSLQLGQVVNVVSDRTMDLGAEDRDGALLQPAAFGFPPAHPFREDGVLIPAGPSAILPYPTVAGGTVNRTTGSATSLQRIKTDFPDVQVESMEGAAFFYACISCEVAALQLRSISNYVEPRNRDAWNMPLAIANLNEAVQRVLAPFIQ